MNNSQTLTPPMTLGGAGSAESYKPYWSALASAGGQRALLIIGGLSAALNVVAVIMALSVPPDTATGHLVKLLYFHVPSAWLAFLSFGVVALTSLLYLWKRERRWDVIALASVEFGVVMTTLTLLSGMMWGYKAWGVPWVWDARLTLTLVMWLIYVGYIMLRAYSGTDEKRARYAAVLGIVGALDIPLIHYAVEWWRGQHPTAMVVTESGPKLAGPLFPPLIFSLLAFTLMYVAVMIARVRLEQKRDAIAARQLEG